jgi:hypothetical protein
MRSPFPGMDPYLEYRWKTVHFTLISAVQAQLQGKLPAGLRARGEQDVFIDESAEADRLLFGTDIAIVEAYPTGTVSSAATVMADPVIVRLEPAVEKHRWVQIIDTGDGDRVVTVIEILSPGNKATGEVNRAYRGKIQEYQSAGVNIVEIDLLRSSRDRLLLTHAEVPPERRAAFYTCVNWARDPSRWAIYPMPLRSRLPVVPIPCRETDVDVPLDLQLAIDRAYLEGGHDDIDYTREARPPLSPDDAAWAAELISAPGPAENM